MPKKWVVVADASRARIFEIAGRKSPMQEVRDFVHPAGRAKNRDLETSPPGRFRGVEARGHTARGGADPVEHEAELFAIELADYLDKARAQAQYAALTLIAPPKFLGLLRRHLTAPAQKLIEKEIPKDLSRSDIAAIEGYVREHLPFDTARGVPRR